MPPGLPAVVGRLSAEPEKSAATFVATEPAVAMSLWVLWLAPASDAMPTAAFEAAATLAGVPEYRARDDGPRADLGSLRRGGEVGERVLELAHRVLAGDAVDL